MHMEKVKWPHNYNCSALITINLSAELFWLQVDEKAINMPKTLSIGEYAMLRGLDRILSVLEEREINATFFVPGKVAEKYPDKIREIANQGHEIASMGYDVENYGTILSSKKQEEFLRMSMDSIYNCCGIIPKGFRVPYGDLTLETFKIAKRLGMMYSSNLSEDDRPFWKSIDHNEKILEIPIQWALYDLPYFALNFQPAFPAGQGRIANYTGVLNNWKDEFAGYYDFGLCYVLQLDPQTIGNPGKIGLIEDLFDYIDKFEGVWSPTCSELFDYYYSKDIS